ncbi:helix-turn-helix transcriptional regulator [Dysosmobacter sp.]|uniref:helix-turn-helix transcriptional regulator n=1 Tax=Dysosmobacter sp. TaxID=2591382 RepID=UPI002A7F6B51|nr:helix-turn-helix transcriptional regulator [Dysosmobacter sp.]MCI6936358.1 helix-turn-helix domain-containing protein [Clostridiales bacterium]MCI7019316.1 helix-turn-helix domain-containing protein [Clostridiales bacterium]MDY3652631.1 helix-turn-helix transcriptional regulator [Dysosmobacter sp.]
MDETFIRNRITELRLKRGISEYQLSLDLGQNRSYIQASSSGRALPSMKQFLNICEYFEITPLQFFDTSESNPQLVKKALDGIRTLSDDDLIMLLGLIARLNQGK